MSFAAPQSLSSGIKLNAHNFTSLLRRRPIGEERLRIAVGGEISSSDDGDMRLTWRHQTFLDFKPFVADWTDVSWRREKLKYD